MCVPKAPEPVAPPQAASDATARAGNRLRDRQNARSGRQSTLISSFDPESRRTGYSNNKTLLGS